MPVIGAAVYFGCDLYRLYDFPPGYRNRPSSGFRRPGEHEFDQADEQINSFAGTNAFGNSPAAVKLAQDFAVTLKTARAKLFTPGSRIELFESTKGEFLTYCELHREECVFLVHVPELRRFEKDVLEKVDARKLLAQAAWMTTQTVLKENRIGIPGMELAVGVRGISQYGPITLGYFKGAPTGPDDGVIKYLDDSTQSHFLWTFFAPEPAGRTNAPANGGL